MRKDHPESRTPALRTPNLGTPYFRAVRIAPLFIPAFWIGSGRSISAGGTRCLVRCQVPRQLGPGANLYPPAPSGFGASSFLPDSLARRCLRWWRVSPTGLRGFPAEDPRVRFDRRMKG